jgi:hypothetical protein
MGNFLEVLNFIFNYNRGCHTSFFLFSENGEWGRGTLSLNGGGPILRDWRMENGENLLWKVLLFFTWGLFFHLEFTLQKVHDGWENGLQIRVCE